MTKTIRCIDLPVVSPGSKRAITVHRYGTSGARPKAYIHAGLHADEIPGMLTLTHLVERLDAAQARGEIPGELIVIPSCNPIGVGQSVNGWLTGRHELSGEGNFNRGWPALAGPVGDRVEGCIGADAEDNVSAIRRAALEVVGEMAPCSEFGHLRKILLELSVDADIVLDVHCDNDSLLHVFLGTDLWPGAADLSADMGSRATLLAVDSGGGSFDEVCSVMFHALGERFAGAGPIPAACTSATIELRGQADVGSDIARGDSAALLRFLQRRGVVGGEPGPLPPALCEATDLDATDVAKAPVAGVLDYAVGLGDQVKKGDVIARVIDPSAEEPLASATPVRAGTDGLVLSRRIDRLVRPGQSVAKIVGTTPVRSGRLLED